MHLSFDKTSNYCECREFLSDQNSVKLLQIGYDFIKFSEVNCNNFLSTTVM